VKGTRYKVQGIPLLPAFEGKEKGKEVIVLLIITPMEAVSFNARSGRDFRAPVGLEVLKNHLKEIES